MIAAGLASASDIDGFYARAAAGLARGLAPDAIVWRVGDGPADLFAPPEALPAADWHGERPFEAALLHRDPRRFALMYRLLHRQRRDRDVWSDPSDREVCALRAFDKAVRRDCHKMRAFVRFRRVADAEGERFVAWFEPEHHIVERNAGFFVRRFANMRWSIVTPDASLHYDGGTLTLGAGGDRRDVPAEDALDAAWQTYFSAIFNPARLNRAAMLREMPRKYWRNMPETALVPGLIARAGARAATMIEAGPGVARKASPVSYPEPAAADTGTLAGVAEGVRACRRCPLHAPATQAVPGEGPADTRVMVVAEQPGDAEDLAGRPLIGPAGRVFDEALKRVGLERSGLYVTNAVKHFKFAPRGKRRLHVRPGAGEAAHCRWWLDREIDLLRPRLIVAMGATAVAAITGHGDGVTRLRGSIIPLADGMSMLVTVHPAYMLRLTGQEEKRRAWQDFLADLGLVRPFLAGPAATAER